jgi:hypothetical protein
LTADAAGDAMPPKCEVIEVHVPSVDVLFNAIDPSPLIEKDLDPRVEEFILSWARSARRDVPLGLLIFVDRSAVSDEPLSVPNAIRAYFLERSASTGRRLSQLFRVGRTSLVVGLVAVAVAVAIGSMVENALKGSHFGLLLRESFSIGGWVAMWRPLEIFLYDWWPIQAERKLYDRLGVMPVRIQLSTARPGSLLPQ